MLEGMVTQIVYRNEANGYTVMELMTDDGEELTAVGYNSPTLGEGERVQLEGVFTMHREYGRQFQRGRLPSYAARNNGRIGAFFGQRADEGLWAGHGACHNPDLWR